jgi:hypothetical protein
VSILNSLPYGVVTSIIQDKDALERIKWWLAQEQGSAYCPGTLSKDTRYADCNVVCHTIWPDCSRSSGCPCHMGKSVRETFKALLDLANVPYQEYKKPFPHITEGTYLKVNGTHSGIIVQCAMEQYAFINYTGNRWFIDHVVEVKGGYPLKEEDVHRIIGTPIQSIEVLGELKDYLPH